MNLRMSRGHCPQSVTIKILDGVDIMINNIHFKKHKKIRCIYNVKYKMI